MSQVSFFASADAARVKPGRRRMLGAVIAASFMAFAFHPAGAEPAFDGMWSVSIVTEAGACENGNGYPVRVASGTLRNAGYGWPISGTVSDSGQVAWAVGRGTRSAAGSGRLSGRSGAGRWKGASCSGTWSAERHEG